jgi:epoxyqueuosine reductase
MEVQLRNMPLPADLKTKLKAQAQALGFAFCGVAKARRLDEEAPKLEAFLKAGHHGTMDWLANRFDMRLDPRQLEPGTKTVVSLLYNYYPPKKQPEGAGLKISCYAYGSDYHTLIRQKLNTLLAWLEEQTGQPNGRGFIDSAPLMDKAWAKLAGLGWVGKHTNLITPGAGSFYFIGTLLLNIDLEPDGPIADYCGTCTRCIDACPTEAIYEPYKLDANKCISYLTIELKGEMPAEFTGKMEGWAFGCDICQDVCPWNRFATPHGEPAFTMLPEIETYAKNDWEEISEEQFKVIFKNSAIKRTKYVGWRRNLGML